MMRAPGAVRQLSRNQKLRAVRAPFPSSDINCIITQCA